MKNSMWALGLAGLLLSTQAYSSTVDVSANFEVLTDVARVFAVLLGFVVFSLGIIGFYNSSKGGHQGGSTAKNVLKLLVGSVLVVSPWFYEFLKASLGVGGASTGMTGEGSRMILAIDPSMGDVGGGDGFLSLMPAGTFKAILAFVMFIGFVAFLSGIYTLKDIADGQAGGKAPLLSPSLRIIGGIVCMNLMWFSCLISAIIGISMICLK